MKKLLIAITLVLAVTSAIFAQAPQKFRYQAVARDLNNLPYSNTSLRIRFAITEDSNNGAIRYFEEQTVNTSALGLFETNIGGGTVLQGSMSGISWGAHPYFVRVELNPDPSGGNFTVMGVSQLLSVPYALYAESAGGGGTGGSDSQELSLSGNQLSISGGNAVTLPDASTTNEIQVLSLSGNILSLSNGGGTVNLPSGGGGGTVNGSTNNLSKFTSANAVGNSSLTEDGSVFNIGTLQTTHSGKTTESYTETNPSALASHNYTYTAAPAVAPVGPADWKMLDVGMSGNHSNINNKSSFYPLSVKTNYSGADTLNNMVPLSAWVENGGIGRTKNAFGIHFHTKNAPNGTMNTVAGMRVENPQNSGTIKNFYGYFVAPLTGAGVNNQYGIYLSQVAGATTHNYGLYSAASRNYIEGLAVGGTELGAKFQVNSGANNTSGMRFGNLNSGSPATSGVAYLGVNSNGDVVVAPTPSGGGGGNTVYTAGSGISITGNVIYNTGDTDNDDTNELQNLSLTGNTLSLSNGGGEVTLPSSGSGFSLPYSGSGSDPDAVFEVTNDGPGIGVLATSTNAGYAGVVAYNTGSGTSASLAGPDYGGYFTGPLRVHSIGNSAPLLEMYDGSGIAQMNMGASNTDGWKFVAENTNFQINNLSTGSFFNMNTNGGIISNLGKLSMQSQSSGAYTQLSSDTYAAELILTSPAGTTFSHELKDGYYSWKRNGVYLVDFPNAGLTFEPYFPYELDLGTSFYRWNTLYAAATNLASDRRLKENIKPTQYGLATVMQLRPVDYFWKNKEIASKQQTGFIAQELETVMPDAVSHDVMTPEQIEACKKAGKPVPEITDPYGINYDAIIPVLVKGMQEQQELIEQLQQQNQMLVKRLETLEKK